MSDQKIATVGLAALFIGVFAPIAMAPFALLDGWVLTKLWAWFIEPLGVPAIRLWAAIGLSMTIGFLTKQHAHDERKPLEVLGGFIVYPLLTLFLGYLVHLVQGVQR